MTGERSSTIKVIFAAFIFIGIINIIKPKTKLLILTILIGSIILLVSNSIYLKNRYVGQFYYYVLEKDKKILKLVYIINYIDQDIMYLKIHQF